MEQGYPLQPYHSYYSNEVEYNDYSPSASWQYARRGPAAFSLPQTIPGHTHQRTSRGYEPLADTHTSYEQSSPHMEKKPGFFSFLGWWLIEIFASFLATGSLAAIVVVLRIYDGRSLTDTHLPGFLTLNGIIAAISTLARVALMVPVGSALSQEAWIWFSDNARQQNECRSRLMDFELSDDASRGAWGSLLFLLFARRRYTAYLGALVTIVSLAFGTFTQQLISVGKFPITDPGSGLMPGHLPRAETWQYYNGVPSEVLLTPPFSIRASIYNGILSDKIDPITVDCATGNCTWPITPSLAFCGGCSPSTYLQQCDDTVCNYTMPSGSSYLLTNTKDGGIGFVVGANSGGSTYNSSIGDKLYIINFDVLGATYKSLGQGFDNSNTAASECALWWCIQSFNASVVGGQLQQNVTMEFSNLTRSTKKIGGTFDNFTFAALPTEMNPSPDVTYNISLIGSASFESMYSLFNGTAFLDIESSAANSDVVDAIWNASSNLDPWIKTVATSMTNALRYDDPYPQPPSRRNTQPAPSRSVYNGTSYQLGVRVRWIWLILPVLCIVSSIVFLIMVMIKTARSPTTPWKGSFLTLLFVEVDQELRHRAADQINRWRGLRNIVGDKKAVLKEDSGGKWSLKAA